MKLYLLEQNEYQSYDTFDSFVVCADNELNAREMVMSHTYWDEWKDVWLICSCTYIWEADEEIKKWIIIWSYNAWY